MARNSLPSLMMDAGYSPKVAMKKQPRRIDAVRLDPSAARNCFWRQIFQLLQ
jgi:hypothetical protein